jgi:hypothetical protein
MLEAAVLALTRVKHLRSRGDRLCDLLARDLIIGWRGWVCICSEIPQAESGVVLQGPSKDESTTQESCSQHDGRGNELSLRRPEKCYISFESPTETAIGGIN